MRLRQTFVARRATDRSRTQPDDMPLTGSGAARRSSSPPSSGCGLSRTNRSWVACSASRSMFRSSLSAPCPVPATTSSAGVAERRAGAHRVSDRRATMTTRPESRCSPSPDGTRDHTRISHHTTGRPHASRSAVCGASRGLPSSATSRSPLPHRRLAPCRSSAGHCQTGSPLEVWDDHDRRTPRRRSGSVRGLR
jgi:hypothetical protein